MRNLFPEKRRYSLFCFVWNTPFTINFIDFDRFVTVKDETFTEIKEFRKLSQKILWLQNIIPSTNFVKWWEKLVVGYRLSSTVEDPTVTAGLLRKPDEIHGTRWNNNNYIKFENLAKIVVARDIRSVVSKQFYYGSNLSWLCNNSEHLIYKGPSNYSKFEILLKSLLQEISGMWCLK